MVHKAMKFLNKYKFFKLGNNGQGCWKYTRNRAFNVILSLIENKSFWRCGDSFLLATFANLYFSRTFTVNISINRNSSLDNWTKFLETAIWYFYLIWTIIGCRKMYSVYSASEGFATVNDFDAKTNIFMLAVCEK